MSKNSDPMDLFLRQLGEFVAVWASLEVHLNHWLTELLGADAKYANMFVSTLPASAKIEKARLLALARFPAEKTKLEDLFNDLNALRDKRNDYVHCAWSTFVVDAGGNHQVNALAPRQKKATEVLKQVPLKLNDLSADTEKVKNKCDEIRRLFIQLGLFS